jgi:hypothetical protein
VGASTVRESPHGPWFHSSPQDAPILTRCPCPHGEVSHSPGASCAVAQNSLDQALGNAATLIAGGGILGGSATTEEGEDLFSGWRGTNMSDEESFNYQYATHGGDVSPEQYAQDARDWAANPGDNGTPATLKDGTTGIRFRTPGGGPGGILDSDGNIVSFWYE